jgi:hypothetical protein
LHAFRRKIDHLKPFCLFLSRFPEQIQDTPQTGVEKKFKDVFGCFPGPFPEGTSLEDKVKTIAKLNRALKAQKGRIAEGSVEKKLKMSWDVPQVLSQKELH